MSPLGGRGYYGKAWLGLSLGWSARLNWAELDRIGSTGLSLERGGAPSVSFAFAA